MTVKSQMVFWLKFDGEAAPLAYLDFEFFIRIYKNAETSTASYSLTSINIKSNPCDR